MTCLECSKEIDSYPCVCGYQPAPSLMPMKKYEAPPPGITKEDFGMHLYETIKTIGGLLGIEQQRASSIHKGERNKLPELLKRRQVLQIQLSKQLPGLANDEMDQVLARYPWVTRC